MEKIVSKVLVAIALGLIVGVSIGLNNEIVSVKYFYGGGGNVNEISPQLAKKFRMEYDGESVIEKKTTMFNYKMAWVNGLLTTSVCVIILLVPNLIGKAKNIS
jgi:hypothetical protein